MKRLIVFVAFLFLAASLVCQAPQPSPAANETKAKKDEISYSIGYDLGIRFKRILVKAETEAMLQGIKDALAGKAPVMSTAELQKIVQEFFKNLREKDEADRKLSAEKNKKEGAAFLKENAKKKGVNTTKTGLQYMIIKEGKGPKPGPYDTVTIHYRGTLIDGTEFHDSYKTGQPVSFQLLKTFPGWTEALRMMNVGSKWKIFLPSDLGMGEDGLGDKVGPNAVIIFDIELLAAKPTKEEKTSFTPPVKKEK